MPDVVTACLDQLEPCREPQQLVRGRRFTLLAHVAIMAVTAQAQPDRSADLPRQQQAAPIAAMSGCRLVRSKIGRTVFGKVVRPQQAWPTTCGDGRVGI